VSRHAETQPPADDEVRAKVALACRILAKEGLTFELVGHVSARVPGSDEMWIRCRGAEEAGVEFTGDDAVRRLDFVGGGPGRGDYDTPLELPIHGEIYRRRPEVAAVIHAHPSAALLCGIAGLDLRPVVGAYDPDALALALEGVPVYPRSVLIDRPAHAHELIDAMAGASTCLMRGHGITVVGVGVEDATIRAIKLERLSRITLELARLGGDVEPLPQAELDDFAQRRQRGPAFPQSLTWLWRHYARRAEGS